MFLLWDIPIFIRDSALSLRRRMGSNHRFLFQMKCLWLWSLWINHFMDGQGRLNIQKHLMQSLNLKKVMKNVSANP